jgi:hypothetical protein
MALVHTMTWALASTCQVVRSVLGPLPAVVIPVDLGVPPPLLVTQGMDEGLAATPGYDRWDTGPGYFASCSRPAG